MDRFYKDSSAVQQLRVGPLAPHLDSFARVLAEQGYADITARQKLNLIADLSKWLKRRNLHPSQLNEVHAKKFLSDRRQRGFRKNRGHKVTLQQFLDHLRGNSVIAEAVSSVDDSPMAHIQNDYALFLLRERGLAEATLVSYSAALQKFLEDYTRRHQGILNLDALGPKDVSQFVIKYTQRANRKQAQVMTSVLRSFFRYLHLKGEIDIDLAACVPSVPFWRLSTIPKFLPPSDVERLLESCDEKTPTGRRNHAILLLLARLGLRAGEIVKLTLDDLDWDAGEIQIKGSKRTGRERIPIPQDVGEALVKYLYGRPRCKTRRIFICMKAPHRGFANASCVSSIVARALTRCKLDPPLKGAHLLRHSLATKMLRSGASLSEIGDVLRHQNPNTTQIYAKCDVEGLRDLAQPWPRRWA